MKYKAVGFDWNGVVFGLPGSVFSQGAAETVGVGVETFRRAYFGNNHLINKDGASKAVFWRAVLEDLKAEDKLPLLMNYVNNFPKGQINQEVLETVRELKDKGLKIGLVSNETLEGAEKVRGSEAAKYFDEILISSEVGFMKPQREMFELMFNKLNTKPEEFVFVDDAEKSLKNAVDIGYTPILFTSPPELKNKLTELGILR